MMITTIRPQDVQPHSTAANTATPAATAYAPGISATLPMLNTDTVTFSGRKNTAQNQRKAKRRENQKRRTKHAALHPNDNSAQAHQEFKAKTRSQAREAKLNERNAARLEKGKTTDAMVIEHPATTKAKKDSGLRPLKFIRENMAKASTWVMGGLGVGAFALQGCEKEPLPDPKPDPEPIGLYSEGFPYNADDYAKIPEYSTNVIHQDGYAMDNDWETGESYTGHNDPALREAIRGDLDGHVPDNRKEYYLSFLDNEAFQKATSPLSARKFLGAMSEGRFDEVKGEWVDANGMKQISQDALDWITDTDNPRLVIADNERMDINPGLPSNFYLMGTYSDYYKPGHPDSGRDIVVWRRSAFMDASPMSWMVTMADEMPTADALFGGQANVAERIQGAASARLAQLYGSLYGPEMFKDGSKAGGRYGDLALLGFLNGTKTTNNIEDGLGGFYLNTSRSNPPPVGDPDANTVEEIITAQQADEGSNDPSEATTPWVNRYLGHLFGSPVSGYTESVWNAALDKMHTFFNTPDNRYGYERDLTN